MAIIERKGVEGLSLREVARQLGVSHQAPYKHFPSRDHILAEIVARAFASFAAHLDGRPVGAGAQADLAAMGNAYLAYAAAHPLQYRLMFGTPLPDPSEHPEMMREARHAFSLLREGLARLAEEQDAPLANDALNRDALYVWASMHGLASISTSDAVDTLGLSTETLTSAGQHGLARIAIALSVPSQLQPRTAAVQASNNFGSNTSERPRHGNARSASDSSASSRKSSVRPGRSRSTEGDHG